MDVCQGELKLPKLNLYPVLNEFALLVEISCKSGTLYNLILLLSYVCLSSFQEKYVRTYLIVYKISSITTF